MDSSDQKITIVIPVFLAFCFIASVFGIVGNALVLGGVDQQPSTSEEASAILRIVISSLLTLAFLLAIIFTSYEIVKPMNYKPRVITSEIDTHMSKFMRKAETWESLFVVAALFVFPIGLGDALIGGDFWLLPFGAALLGIPIYTYTTREKLRDSLRKILPSNNEIGLQELSRLLSKEAKKVKKEVLYLISFEKFPATYHFDSQIIYYHGEQIFQKTTQDVPTQDIIASNPPQARTSESRPSAPCAYCGETPLVPNAKFCSECGASMVSAK
ncbi:MAG: zinc ribbon domain-containing protein [Candidatus Kariarchaeaceae archaeon]|jgi:hypothetical protein